MRDSKLYLFWCDQHGESFFFKVRDHLETGYKTRAAARKAARAYIDRYGLHA